LTRGAAAPRHADSGGTTVREMEVSPPAPSPDAVVVTGVSGAGKTAIAEGIVAATGWVFAEGDSFHPPANVAKMRSGRGLDDEDRWPWLAALRDWIAEQARAGMSTVVTCSALRRVYRDVLREGNPAVRFCALQVDGDLLRRRVQSREGHFMPASLLASQLDLLEPLAADEPGVQVDASGEVAVVVRRALASLGLPQNRDATP
jgi:gluconokinase